MKNEIRFADYYKYLSDEEKKDIDAELSTSEIDVEDMVIKRVSGEEIKAVDDEHHTSSGYASTRVMDFSGDVVIPSGINLTVFNKNPIIHYNHFTSNLPIGKATKMRRDAHGLKITVQYAVEEYEEAATIYRLVKGGYLKQHSIGFIPLEAYRKGQNGYDELSKALKKKYPEYHGDAERIITKALLLEVSVVNIADNQASMITDVKTLLLDEDMESLKKLGITVKEAEVVEPVDPDSIVLNHDPEVLELLGIEVPVAERTIEMVTEPAVQPTMTLISGPPAAVKANPLTPKQCKMIKVATIKGKILRT